MNTPTILARLLSIGFEHCFLDTCNPNHTIIVNNRGDIDGDTPEGPFTLYNRIGERTHNSYDNIEDLIAAVCQTWPKQEPRSTQP